jgi:hypothetical protein
VAGYRRSSLQRRSNLHALFSVQRSELKSVLSSQGTNNLRRDYWLAGTRQRDFERNELAHRKGLSNERVQATFAEITCPALYGKALAVPFQANPNSCLEQIPG